MVTRCPQPSSGPARALATLTLGAVVAERAAARSSLGDSEDRQRLAVDPGRLGTGWWTLKTDHLVGSPRCWYALIRPVRALESASVGGTWRSVALTVFASKSDREQALALGFEEHLAKPTSPNELSRTVARLVRRAA